MADRAMVRTVLYAGRRAGLGHERTRAAGNVGQEPGALEKWMRILFVHPEGNLANNSNLSAIIEFLTGLVMKLSSEALVAASPGMRIQMSECSKCRAEFNAS